jgi:ribosomal protein S15P/S13E
MKDIFIVVPDSDVIEINPRVHSDDIIVSPCSVEHWISTDLFKFRIHAERQKLHVIGKCHVNQVPLYSLFCDEITLVDATPTWYDEGSATGNNNKVIRCGENHIDIEAGPYRDEFMAAVTEQEVIDRFHFRKVYLLKSAYEKFQEVKNQLPQDVIIVEYKIGFVGANIMNLKEHLPAIGADHKFQRNLVEMVGIDNYMTTQIMGSNFLNWQFLCYGGSSNLLCVLPVKALAFQDPTLNESVEKVIRGFAKKRHGFVDIPYINVPVVAVPFMKSKRGRRVLTVRSNTLAENKINNLRNSFARFKRVWQEPEIILI